MTASPFWLRPASVLAFATFVLAASGLAGCQEKKAAGNEAGAPAAGAQAAAANPCGLFAPTATSTLPMQTGNNPVELDCSAWQAFIALNWKSDPNNPGQPDPTASWASFGTPGDMDPKVWETYLEAAAVFAGNGNAPLKGMWSAKRPAIKTLFRTSKFGAVDLTDIDQAGSGHHWLTSQRREITYYEVMMNKDEFEFITQDGFDLTTAAGQLACATQPGKPISDGPPPPPGAPKRGGLNMPAGQANGWDDTDCAGNIKAFGQGVGAMEVKAAWTPLPADHSLDYRYKTAVAMIRDPITRTMRKVTVGLVGLHIIRKRFPRLPWIWATFEQIDNSPDEAPNNGFSPPALPANPNRKPSPGFTFFNPTCNPANDKAYHCMHNAPPTRCLLGTPPDKCQPYNAPMQITRINPVGDPANQVTAYAWSLLPANSVFNYYRLVNVQWPQQGIGQPPKNIPPGPGLTVPLYMGNPTPAGAAGGPSQIVSNTTLESFQQKSNSCMDCHVYASIATANALQATTPGGLRRLTRPTANGPPQYASDYSFIFFSETKR
jgi:hypothetical protein